MAKILLVEDDASTRDMLQRTLSGEGHEVTTASDGREGLSEAATATFDLVVTDISMPEVDGVSMAEALLNVNAQLPIILMSAIADELVRAKSLPGQFVRVIGKPVSLEQMRSEVKAALGT